MPFVPSPLARSAARVKWLAIASILAVASVVVSCASQSRRAPAADDRRSIDAGASIAVALGNLRIGEAPTPADIALSQFLFGTDPQPALRFVKPVDVCVADSGLIVGDGALAALLFWNGSDGSLAAARADIAPQAISAMATAPNGDILVADAASATVMRVDAAGRVATRYASPQGAAFRPGGVAAVGDEIWITNAAAHRIEIFDAAGAWKRAFGTRGRGPGEFGMPLGIAVTPSGDVAVVDMLNCRVQEFSPTGDYLRAFGGPGNVPGTFGRPRTIAVGPDGVVFVTDAATQRVHAFSPGGRSLGAFGGGDASVEPLALPAGIAISPSPVAAVAGDASAKYYVLVAEQLLNPGIRVYAWQGPTHLNTVARPRTMPASAQAVADPHWDPGSCRVCHGDDPSMRQPIAGAQADALCLSCHDGKKASDEAHPIGRVAATVSTRAPDGWPLVDGRLGCLTCHDMKDHCAKPERPIDNPNFIRGYEAGDSLASCRNCHAATDTRMNPHLTIAATSCGFCHQRPPEIPADGVARGDPLLRAPGSRVCLGCHVVHPDPAPRGHLGAEATPAIRMNLAAAADTLDGPGAASSPLPLAEDRVQCYTCHNPHAPGLFGAATPLGRRADPADPYNYHLRLDATALCVACHGK